MLVTLFFNSRSDVEAQNRTNLERVICLLSGSDSGALIALLRKMALEEEERAAVRVRALMALEASLSDDQLMEHIGLHSYTLKLRIKVLNFLSRLEFLGLVYKVTNKEQVCTAFSGLSNVFS